MINDIKTIIQQANESLREGIKEVGITVKAVQSDVKHIVEAVDTHTKQLEQMDGRLQTVEKDLAEVKDDVAAIKITLEGNETESPLKQRIEELETNQKR